MMRAFLRIAAFGAAGLTLAYGFGLSEGQADRWWLLCLLATGVFLAVSWWPANTKSLPIYNRTLLRWVTIVVVVFVIISVQLVRIQIVESQRISNRVELTDDGEVAMNPRERLRALEMQRGRIFDREGRVLADTVEQDDGTYRRTWPEATTASLIGYYSPLLYGASNLEAEFDEYLAGETGGNQAEEWLADVLHEKRRGYDLRLTIDLDLQKLADELLAGRPGGIVLMDAKTGDVLAMTGAPSFDPNQLYANEGQQSDEEIAAVEAYWAQLSGDLAAPLIFRPTQGLYSPGSTFKTVTSTALIDSGMADLDTIFRDEGVYDVDGRIIIEANRPDPNKVDWTLEESYAWSLNVVYAQIGLQLTAERLEEYAARFGFGESIPFDIPTAETQLASGEEGIGNRTLLADTAFGQGEILASPLQMAMVVAAIANGGEMMEPNLVHEVVNHEGDVLERFGPDVWQRVVPEESAAMVRDLLLASADYGYASAAKIDGVTVGAKTGTAEVGEGEPHAWFTAFAEDGERSFVVSVVVENGGAGSATALPIGRQLLDSALADGAQP